MRISLLSACAVIAALSAGMLNAQEQLPLEELLRWFPYGTYSHIAHYDLKRLRKAEAYPVFCKYLDVKDYSNRIRVFPAVLPPVFEEGITSATRANLIAYKVLTKDDDLYARPKHDLISQRGLRGHMIFGYGGTVTGLDADLAELIVLRFDLLEPRLEEALKEGAIADTGRRLHKKAIYSFHYHLDLGEGDYFAWATPTGELLLAADLDNLEKMANAGLGLDLSLLDDEHFLPLSGLFPELGHYWYFYIGLDVAREFILEREIEAGTSDDVIARIKDSIGDGSQYRVRTVLVTDEIIEREIHVHGSASVAEEDAGQLRRRFRPLEIPAWVPNEIRRKLQKQLAEMPQGTKEYLATLEASQKVEIDGTTVVTETIHDRKLIQAMLKSAKAWEESREEREKAKDKKNEPRE